MADSGQERAEKKVNEEGDASLQAARCDGHVGSANAGAAAAAACARALPRAAPQAALKALHAAVKADDEECFEGN